jgi:hypothetical protein
MSPYEIIYLLVFSSRKSCRLLFSKRNTSLPYLWLRTFIFRRHQFDILENIHFASASMRHDHMLTDLKFLPCTVYIARGWCFNILIKALFIININWFISYNASSYAEQLFHSIKNTSSSSERCLSQNNSLKCWDGFSWIN